LLSNCCPNAVPFLTPTRTKAFSTAHVDPAFEIVIGKLEESQAGLEQFPTEALEALNNGVAAYNDFLHLIGTVRCPTADPFPDATSALEPWTGKSGETAWATAATGAPAPLARDGDETNADYVGRIYDVAGICTAERGCTLAGGVAAAGKDCNGFEGCVYPCRYATQVFKDGYGRYVRQAGDGLAGLNTGARAYNDALSATQQNICPVLEEFVDAGAPLRPWTGRSGRTGWVLGATGARGNYGRQGSETNLAYVARIYDSAVASCQGRLDVALQIYADYVAGMETGLGLLHDGTAAYNALVGNGGAAVCPVLPDFPDAYTALHPWYGRGAGLTDWTLRATGVPGRYARSREETNVQYLERIYNVAGTCAAGGACALDHGTTTESVGAGGACNGGVGCVYPCAGAMAGVINSYRWYIGTVGASRIIQSNLGVACPYGYRCPTQEFQALGGTVLQGVEAFRDEINALVALLQGKMTTLLDNAAKSILCEIDCYDLASGVEKVGRGLCEDLLGQVWGGSLALWCLSVFLNVAAVAAAVLRVRLQGRGAGKEQDDSDSDDSNSEDSDSESDGSTDSGSSLPRVIRVARGLWKAPQSRRGSRS